jgi:hypothetical protein
MRKVHAVSRFIGLILLSDSPLYQYPEKYKMEQKIPPNMSYVTHTRIKDLKRVEWLVTSDENDDENEEFDK